MNDRILRMDWNAVTDQVSNVLLFRAGQAMGVTNQHDSQSAAFAVLVRINFLDETQ